MTVGINDFWKLAVKSGAVTADQAHALHAQYTETGGGADLNGDATPLAQWLIGSNVLSKYQARVLLKGLAGPFRFGDYRVADRFPDERFRQTFRAVHAPSGHPVILRFYDATVVPDESMWPMVADAVGQLTSLHSPRIHRYFEWCELGNYRFAVLDDFAGESLVKRLESRGPIEWEAACRIIRQVAEAMVDLHTLGRAHVDIRPENIWLTEHDCVYLSIEPIYWMTPLSLIVNSPLDAIRLEYLAPELTVAGHAPDTLTDLYALGCTFYQLLTGDAPFADAQGSAKIECHVKEAPRSLEEQGVPSPVEAVVRGLMAKNPPVRLQTPQEVITLINTIVPTSDPLPLLGPTRTALEEFLSAAEMEVVEAADESPPPAESEDAPPIVVTTSPTIEPDSVEPDAAGPDLPTPESPRVAPIVTEGAPTGRRRSRRRKRSSGIFVWIGAALLLAAGAYFAYPHLTSPVDKAEKPSKKTKQSETAKEVKKQSTGDKKQSAGTEAGAKSALVADDGQTLWADPAEGRPISLAYLPPGGQLFVVCRPADLDAAEAATKFQAALGPRWEHYRKQWESLTKIPWGEMEQLVLSFGGGEAEFPRPAIVAYLKDSPGEAELATRWGGAPPTAIGGKRVYGVGDFSAYFPADQEGRVLVLGSKEQIAEVIEFDGAPPVLLRQLTRLLASSNDRHHVSIFAIPSYLQNNLLRDDFEFYFGDPSKVRDWLGAVLIDEVTALRVSVFLDDPVFVEARLNIGSAPDAVSLLKTQRDRLRQQVDWSEERISSVTIAEYWRRVSLRYPQMLRFLNEYIRGQAAGRELVFNTVLPRTAPANLLVGGEMLLLSGESTSATKVAGKESEKKTPANMESLLQSKMSMMFDQTSLDFAIRDLEAIVKDEFPGLGFPFAITIIGGDLQLAGITQNQQVVNFREENKTLSEILTAIVMKANPITTVKKPSEDDQKLIWVIGPDPQNADRQIILVTTRDAAMSKKYTLPQPFVP